MRVLLVSPGSLRKNAAGIEESVYFLGKSLLENGHDVEVYCTAESPVGKTSLNGLTITEFPRIAPNNAYFFSWEMYRAIQRENHDIIHCYGYNNLCSVFALLAKKNNQKYILTGASSISSSPIRKWLHYPLNWLYTFLGKKIDKIICVSEYEYELFRKTIHISPRKFVRIPNGINVDEWTKIKKKKNNHMILSVGRLVRQKGMHRLISALPIILKKYPHATLHIVGDGVERINLEKQAQELGVKKHVTFYGHIQLEDRNKLHELYARAHVFSLMADSESQGLVYGMAAATRTPIVATHSSAMKDLVKARAAIGIENPDDTETVAKGIMDSFEKPLPVFDINEVIWSWDRIGKEVSRIYNEVLSPSSAPSRGKYPKNG